MAQETSSATPEASECMNGVGRMPLGFDLVPRDLAASYVVKNAPARKSSAGRKVHGCYEVTYTQGGSLG